MARFLIPSVPLHSLHQEMNHLFDDIFHGGLSAAPQVGSRRPTPMILNVDVIETEKEVRICAELPGVEDSDIDVSLDGDILTIGAEKKFERANEKESYHFMERSYGSFQRSLRLPCTVNPDQVQATFTNGLLTVTLSKCEEKDTSRKILVQGDKKHDATQGVGKSAAAQPTQAAQEHPQAAAPKKSA